MKFNINKYVKVRLTDFGRLRVKEYFKSIGLDSSYLVEDEAGWSKWQLWDLMSTLGPDISMGFELPFETEIEIL